MLIGETGVQRAGELIGRGGIAPMMGRLMRLPVFLQQRLPHLLVRAQQGVHADAVKGGQPGQKGNIRPGDAVFPPADGLLGDVQQLRRLFLREALAAAKGPQIRAEIKIHTYRSFHDAASAHILNTV